MASSRVLRRRSRGSHPAALHAPVFGDRGRAATPDVCSQFRLVGGVFAS